VLVATEFHKLIPRDRRLSCTDDILCYRAPLSLVPRHTPPFVRVSFSTDRAAEKSAIYGIIETRFFEGKKGKFDVGLN
jgi:hypothetical protein